MIDTHAHLQDEKFDNVEIVLSEAKTKGVDVVICASSDLNTSKQAVKISQTFDNVYATVGIHPHDANSYNDDIEKQIEFLASNKKVVAIGEIGLDYHYMFSPKEMQKKVFEKQIDLANQLKLPVVIHSREATGDTMEIIRKNLNKLTNGVCIHCFNMSLEILKEINKYGFYISVGGIVTFKNASNVVDVVKECNEDKLMLETDCPYLAPVPYRSKINEPKYIPVIAQKIAEIRGTTQGNIERVTTQNAKRFFNL